MPPIVAIIALILIFVLLWVAIGYLPGPPLLQTALYIVLIVVACYYLYTRFVA